MDSHLFFQQQLRSLLNTYSAVAGDWLDLVICIGTVQDLTLRFLKTDRQDTKHQQQLRSRFPRSLLTAHSVAAGAWFDLIICISTVQDLTLRLPLNQNGIDLDWQYQLNAL
jgi:hypothetical protein